MATSLTGTGTLSYNGWTFAGPRVSTTLDVRPERESSGRHVTHLVFTLNVVAYITDDSNGVGGSGGDAGNVVATIQDLLTEDGGALVCTGMGYGNISVNGGSTDRDIAWGPKPKLISMIPVGSSGCIELNWQVEWSANRCSGGSSQLFGQLGEVISATYGMRYSMDHAGLTTRTIRGEFRMAINRATVGGGPVAKTADELRDRLDFPPLVNFKRESQEWELSEDKSRLNFTITDRELPSDNGYPVGVASISATHTVSAEGGAALTAASLQCEIRGSVEMAKPYTKSDGMERILLLVGERMKIARNQANEGGKGVIMTGLSITEHIFDRRVDFSFRYMVLNSGGLKRIATSTGLFTELKSTNHAVWTRSMEDTAYHNRGAARLRHQAVSDRIVNPCQSSGVTLRPRDTTGESPGSDSIRATITGCPPESRSYVRYRNWIDAITDSDTIEHKPMIREEESGADYNDEVIKARIKAGAIRGLPPRQKRKIVSQQTGSQSVEIRIHGEGLRAGYDVEVPKLVEIFGQEADAPLKSSRVTATIVGEVGGCKIYAAKWDIKYIITFETQQEMEEAIGDLSSAVLGVDSNPNGEHIIGTGNNDGAISIR